MKLVEYLFWKFWKSPMARNCISRGSGGVGDYHISMHKPVQQVYNAKLNLKTGTIIYNTIDNQTSGLRTRDMK
jgi:hypothetical protein